MILIYSYFVSKFNYRDAKGIRVLFISDVNDKGDKSSSFYWSFEELASLIVAKKLRLLRFNLLDIQANKLIYNLYINHS